MENEETLDLLAYLKRLRQHLLPAALVGLVVLALVSLLGIARARHVEEVHAVKAHVLVRPAETNNPVLGEAQAQLMPQILRTFVGLEDAPTFVDAVSKKLGGKYSPEQVADMTSVYWGGGSLLLAVQAQAPREQDAMDLANAGAEVLAADGATILGEQTATAPRLTVVQKAFVDPDAVAAEQPSRLGAIMRGIVAGAFAATATAMLLEWLASRRRRTR